MRMTALVLGVAALFADWTCAQEGSAGGIGVTLVPLQVVIIGPVVSCGQVRLPSGTNHSGLHGCPSAIEVIPGYYRPVPMAGWRLIRATRLYSQVYRYECVHHTLFGFLPIIVHEECIGPHGPEKGSTFVVSWEAAPVTVDPEEVKEVEINR